FIRERSYYPNLCLIQIATEEISAIIDPLAISDLSPLVSLLKDPAIVKVFHAGDQDCAILYHELGVVPAPLFDTQHAATLLDISQQTGLMHLVRHYCGVYLDKRDTFTDWLRRPLSAQQIDYALADVAYLPYVYARMVEDLTELGRLSWLSDDFKHMSDEANYEIDLSKVWHKVKGSQSLSQRRVVLIQALAAWRERVAQQKNYPRRWIIADEQLIEVVKREPQTTADLMEIRGIREKLSRQWAKELLAELKAAQEIPEELWPKREPGIPKGLEFGVSVDLMTALVRLRASENHISSMMLATRDDLARIAAGARGNMPLLTGWRYEIVGAELLDLLAGKLSLHLEDGALHVSRRE
ncbi:MAG: ribonuclease D, partial [Coriobacteriia bacterium]|nr:ribonuclease D [Coriobacteriia bacterium]